MTNHLAADCKASDAKKAEFKKKNGGKGFRDLEEPDGEDLGAMYLCQVCEPGQSKALQQLRNDATDRTLTFKVDSAACRTVVNSKHAAARGYKIHADEKKGQLYGTAKRGGPKIEDEGLRVLQTQSGLGELPQRIRARCADVSGALMAVCDLVDHGHRVVFDQHEAFAQHRTTGRRSEFTRVGKSWEYKVQLEAPAQANRVATQLLAEMRDAAAAAPAAAAPGGAEMEVDRAEPLFRMAAWARA